jgi:hypothetical protein
VPQPAQDLRDEPTSGRRSIVSRAGLALAGWASVALAAVGAVLPLVPTTPFLLLAAACFVRSSPRAHRWLHGNRVFGPFLREWQRTHSVPLRAKVLGILVIAVSAGTSFVRIEAPWARVIVVAVAVITGWSLVRLRTSSGAAAAGEIPSLPPTAVRALVAERSSRAPDAE